MDLRKTFFFIIAFVAALSMTVGCATAPSKPRKKSRLFFPKPPTDPKLEFKGVYVNQHQFPKSDGQRFKEKIFGPDPAIGPGRPFDVASDGKGKVYVSDIATANIFIFDLVNYKVKTLAPLGTFEKPMGIALDDAGNIYVTDLSKEEILVFDKEGKPAFSFGKESGKLDWPVGVTVDDKLGRVYVVNSHGHDVAVFDKKGEYLFSIGKRGEGGGGLNYPVDVVVTPDGRVVVADAMNAKIQIFDKDGKFLKDFGKRGDGLGEFQLIKGLGIDSDNNLYVSDATAVKVEIFDLEGNYLMSLGGPYNVTQSRRIPPGGFVMPSGIGVDAKNGIYVADQLGRYFQVFQYLDEEYLKEHPISE